MATLLETVFAMPGTPEEVEQEVILRLLNASLRLTGTFRGAEADLLGPDRSHCRHANPNGDASPARPASSASWSHH